MDSTSFIIRVPKRLGRIAAIVGVLALIVAPLAAVATHSFNDVPNSHTFHGNIEWLKASGVTKGCNPPANTLFCPDDNVTRGQMAAFMERFAEYLGAEDGTPAQADNADTVDGSHAADLLTRAVTVRTEDEAGSPLVVIPNYTAVATVDIVAPSDGAVVVQYSLSANGGAADTDYRVGLSAGSNCSNIDGNTHVYGTVESIGVWDTASGTATFDVGSGTHSYTLCGQANVAAAQIDGSSLTALFVGEGASSLITSTSTSGGGGDSFDG